MHKLPSQASIDRSLRSSRRRRGQRGSLPWWRRWRKLSRASPRRIQASLHEGRQASLHCPLGLIVGQSTKIIYVAIGWYLTGSGLCEAVTMTPTVLPSSFLLRRPAMIPTLNSTESRVFPLSFQKP